MFRRADPGLALLVARLLVLALFATSLTGCGGGAGGVEEVELGTLVLKNATDEGLLPRDILQLFMQPSGTSDLSDDLLSEPILPGNIVIIGQFPEGIYDVLAIVEGNFSVPFNLTQIRANAPTTLELRFD